MAETNTGRKMGSKLIACMLTACLAIACAALAAGSPTRAYADVAATGGKVNLASTDAGALWISTDIIPYPPCVNDG